jgi:hypothetical protein
MKKIILVGIALIMLFSFVACNGVSLSRYKSDAKEEIGLYVGSESYYTPENLELRRQIVEDGKNAIDKAKKKADVDSAVAMTMDKLNYIFSNTRIDPETRAEIDRLYIKWFEPNNTIEEVSRWIMDCYYGQYNDFYFFLFIGWGFLQKDVIIDGLSFSTHNSGGILAVKEDFGGTLEEVHENGYITRADLETIYEINNGTDFNARKTNN